MKGDEHPLRKSQAIYSHEIYSSQMGHLITTPFEKDINELKMAAVRLNKTVYKPNSSAEALFLKKCHLTFRLAREAIDFNWIGMVRRPKQFQTPWISERSHSFYLPE